MVNLGSNAVSDGVPFDHSGERLEDAIPFVDGLENVRSAFFLGNNPSFQGDIPHGESNPMPPSYHFDASSGSVEGDVIVHSVESDETLNQEEVAAAAAKASDCSTIFQINANERESAIAVAKRVQDLQRFILSKGFSLDDVSNFTGMASSSIARDDFGLPSSIARDDFGLPSLQLPLTNPNDDVTCVDVLNTLSKNTPNIQHQMPPVSDSLVLDYYPMPSGASVVSPPDEILRKGIEKFKCCLVGKFTKDILSFSKVSELAHKALDSRGLITVSQKDSSQFFFKFDSEVNMNAVLSRGGTWYFERNPMLVRPWGSV